MTTESWEDEKAPAKWTFSRRRVRSRDIHLRADTLAPIPPPRAPTRPRRANQNPKARAGRRVIPLVLAILPEPARRVIRPALVIPRTLVTRPVVRRVIPPVLAILREPARRAIRQEVRDIRRSLEASLLPVTHREAVQDTLQNLDTRLDLVTRRAVPVIRQDQAVIPAARILLVVVIPPVAPRRTRRVWAESPPARWTPLILDIRARVRLLEATIRRRVLDILAKVRPAEATIRRRILGIPRRILDILHSLGILASRTHMVTTILDTLRVTHRDIRLKATILRDISKATRQDISKDITLLGLLLESLILEISWPT